jgi:stage III sporulation protein AH
MKFVIVRRWTELSLRHKLGTGIASLVVLLLLGLGIGYAYNSDTPPGLSGVDSLPVNAGVENQIIQFSTETAKPLPQGEAYFVNYRLKREESRQEAKSMLAPLLNTSVSKTKEEAQQKWLELTHKIEKEGEIENLLKIKGFQDAVVDVSKNGVNVIIYSPALSRDEVLMIQDIVVRIANVRIDQISISFKI